MLRDRGSGKGVNRGSCPLGLSALAVPGDRPTSPNDRHRVNTNDSPIANKERARGYTRSSLR